MAGIEQVFGSVDFTGPTLGFLKWFIWPLLLFGIGYLLYWMISFNVKVTIYSPNSNGSIGTKDKGKIIRDKKNKSIKTFKLMKNKNDWIGLIPQKYFIPTIGIFNRVSNELCMIRDHEGKLQPIHPPRITDVKEWEGMSVSDIQWAITEINKGAEVYLRNDFWSKYGGILIPIVGFAIIGVIMLVLFSELDTIATAFNNAADKAAQAIQAANGQVIS